MSGPRIHGRHTGFSVSDALATIGETLATIREEDSLSWKDMGRILGKSDDRAADYAKAVSEMPVSAFLLACREWNGRFANPVLAQIGQRMGPSVHDEVPDNQQLSRVLALAHLMSMALADNGRVDDDELEAIPSTVLDDAARAIGALCLRKHGVPAPALRSVADAG